MMFRHPVQIERAADEVVMRANPVAQARLLCHMLTASVPLDVSNAFAEMTGADPEKILQVSINMSRQTIQKRRKQHASTHKGNEHWKSVLTEQNVRYIFVSTKKARVLAQEMKVHLTTIYDIRRRKTWRYVTNKLKRPQGYVPERIAKTPTGRNRWYSPDQVREIRKRCSLGESRKVIAADFDTTTSTISRIEHRKTYAKIGG
jgi:hypothetical protein